MIRATAEVQNVDAIHVAITLTMSVGEWKQVAAKLNESPSRYFPHIKSADVIESVIRKMLDRVTEIAKDE